MNSTKHFTAFPMGKTKMLCAAGAARLAAQAAFSIFKGKYPRTFEGMLRGDAMQLRVFWTLRAGRTAVGILGGFALGVAGYVYQTVFRNPLASPDVIGVSSGASAGAAAGILFLSGAAAVTFSAFTGALAAVCLALALSALDRAGRNSTIVLAGIAVHSLAQTVLMCLKLTADPERELASIEYWIMGSLNGISGYSIGGNLLLCLFCLAALFLLHRQILLAATLAVACVVSLSGLISFVGLLAPHGARLLLKCDSAGTMLLGGILGGILLTGADILARSAAATELPVSIFTSLLGAPFLIYLIIRGRQRA